MAWIESHDDLATHPKTRRAARALGISIPTMMGHLHLLWHWCLKYAETGDLGDYDAMDIADAMMWEGDPDELIEALVNCGPGDRHGFLERDANGRLAVHDWLDYAGRLVQARREASEAGAKGNHERWHVQRGIIDPNCPFCQEGSGDQPDGNPDPIGGRSGGDQDGESGSDRVLSHRTVPDRTVPKPNQEGIQTDIPTASRAAGEPPPDPVSPSVDDPLSRVTAAYHAHIGILGRSQFDRLRHWHDEMGMPAEVIVEAIAIASENGSRRIEYIDGTLRNWYNDGIRTVKDARSTKARRRTRADPRASPGHRETAVDRMLRERGVQLA